MCGSTNTLAQVCALSDTGEAALTDRKHQTESDPSRIGDQGQEAALQAAPPKAGRWPALGAYSTSSALGHSSKDRFAPHLLRRLPWDPCGDDYCRCQHNPVPGPRSVSGSLHLPSDSGTFEMWGFSMCAATHLMAEAACIPRICPLARWRMATRAKLCALACTLGPVEVTTENLYCHAMHGLAAPHRINMLMCTCSLSKRVTVTS